MPEQPPKPAVQLPAAESVPESLRGARRWVGWKYKWDKGKGKWKKPPCSALTGEEKGWNRSGVPFAEALEGAVANGLDGVGFVFLDGDGLVGVDFDDCRRNGEVDPAVAAWLRNWFSGTYAETSPSGTGVHVICLGRIPRAVSATQLKGAAEGATVEVYSKERYFTWTGQSLDGHGEVAGKQLALDKLLAELGAAKTGLPGEQEGERAMSALTAKALHEQNLAELTNAPQGAGNNTLNTAAFFAARAHKAGVLDGTEQSIKQRLFDIVTKEWAQPHPGPEARETIESGWGSGLEKPLEIAEDPFPEVAETISQYNDGHPPLTPKGGYFWVKNFGGKPRVCFMEESGIAKGRSMVLVPLEPNGFLKSEDNHLIQVGLTDDNKPILKGKGTVWATHKRRRTFNKVVFRPEQKAAPGEFNLWTGFAYTPRKGDCGRYLEHVFENICKGDRKKYDYLLGWMAYAVRNPWEQGHVAVVIKGLKGVGKNVFAEAFAALWNGHALVISDGTHITNNFNAHLRALCVLVADEAFFAGDRRHEGKLKALITGDTIAIEAKGVDVTNAPNLLHIIMLSNERWVVPASFDERRFLALSCSDKRRRDSRYFGAINRQLREQGGYEALLHHLMHEVDLSGFDVRQAPHTEELQEQMVESLRDADRVWFECLYNGIAPGKLQKGGQLFMRTADFIDWAASKDASRWGQLKPTHVGNMFGPVKGDQPGFGFSKPQTMMRGERLRYWVVPPLAEARRIWDETRFKYKWPDDGGEWDTPGEVNF